MNSNARTRVRAIFLAAIMLVSVVAMSGAFVGGVAAAGGVNTQLTDTDGDLEDVDVTVPGVGTTVEVTGLEGSNDIVIFYDDDNDGYQSGEQLAVVTNSDESSSETVTVNLTDSDDVSVGDAPTGDIEVIEETDSDGTSSVSAETNGDATSTLNGADVVAVSTDGSTTSGNGADALSGLSISSGDRVLVASSHDGSGSAYTGKVSISSSGVVLESAFGKATIDANGEDGTAVGIEATDVRVEGFIVQNFVQNGITIFGEANGAEVVDNTVDTSSTSQATSFAVNTDDGGADNLLIKNNKLGYGITGSLQLNQNSEVTVKGNTISDAQGEAEKEIGILVGGGSDITITESTISGANVRGIFAGSRTISPPASLDSLDINSNNIIGNNNGVIIAEFGDPVTSVSINQNNLQSNTNFGVATTGDVGQVVDATSNWWGDDDGPDADGNPATTSGAGITGDVTFEPWAGAEINTDNPNPSLTSAKSIGDDGSTTIDTGSTTVSRANIQSNADTSGGGGSVTTSVSNDVPSTGSQSRQNLEEDVSSVDENAQVVSAVNINPSDADVRDSSATLEFTLSRSNVGEPSNIRVVRFNDGYESLPTSVVDTTSSQVTVQAQTPGFSLFAIVETDPPEPLDPDPLNLTASDQTVPVGENVTLTVINEATDKPVTNAAIELPNETVRTGENGTVVTSFSTTGRLKLTTTGNIDASYSPDSLMVNVTEADGSDNITIGEYRNQRDTVDVGGLRSAIDDFTTGDIDINLLREVINEFTA